MSILDNLFPGQNTDMNGLLGLALLSKNNNGNNNPLRAMILSQMLGGGSFDGNQPIFNSGGNDNLTSPSLGSGTIPRLSYAIGQLESGGRYNELGPVTGSGDRAYGRYQVMGSNVPSWTKLALGNSMSPSEFLKNPSAQDAVANYILGKYYNQYGNINDAASMWFSGKPASGNYSRDILGTSVPQYIRTVNRYFNSY